MATLINLGIDCGKSEEVADKIVAHFKGYCINLIDAGEVECEIWKEKNQFYGYWCVGIWPIGLGLGIRFGVTETDETDILDYHQAIGFQLYSHLSMICGYRTALFGAEIFDMLKDREEQDEEETIMEGTIYNESKFPHLKQDGSGELSFIPGYAVYSSKYTENTRLSNCLPTAKN